MNLGAGLILILMALGNSARGVNPALPVIPANVFNVTNYGAIGDGAKDNTTKIQNTINAASVAGGGIVRFRQAHF